MPRVPAYTLAWSPTTKAYELYETRDRRILSIVPDSPEWFAWLEQVSSFAFSGKHGHYTARKEARARGNCYWSAYLVTGERLSKKYLGKSSDLTLARLEHIAAMLFVQSEHVHATPTISAVEGADFTQESHPLPPLLTTKLYIPRPRSRLVLRAHLMGKLQQGMEYALTLVSAPAGFGKTTLLAQWVAQSAMQVAWVSLEGEDNDPSRFLSALIAALQTLNAQLGATALTLLNTPNPPSPEHVLALLTDDLMRRGTGDILLVLDDYHVITADSIQRGMAFFVEHLPPQLHLVLATRADPPLPLARLRVHGQLAEIRAAELRFSLAEASAFLQDVMGLSLEAPDITTLERKTEGWIAGLQLAALSLQGRTDISAFLAAFTGSHRYVLDYLSDEVLARQPTLVQQFLLYTSILDQLNESLCDAVIGQQGSQAMLEVLDKANLFVIALDEERGWYRYHHLFADVLRRHLQQREPARVPELHRRASAWYEQHALTAKAVQHALAIPDFERAARLIEPIAGVMLQAQISMVLGWMNTFPDNLVRSRPFLCVYYAYLLSLTNRLEAAEARLQEAERAAQDMPAEQEQIIRGYVFAIRASIANYSGDVMHTVSLARQALMLLPQTEAGPHTGALGLTLRAYQVSGDVTAESEREAAAVVSFICASDYLIPAVYSITQLARLHVLQGKLRQAAGTYAQVIQLVPRPEILHSMPGSIVYYFGLGDLLRERNELEAAEQHLLQGMTLMNEALAVEALAAILGYTALARLQIGRGNTSAAFATLDALAQLSQQRHFSVLMMSKIAAIRAYLELVQGNLLAALDWADSSGLSFEDEDLPYLREDEYLILARVCIVQGHNDPERPYLQDVLCLLDRLLRDAEAKARINSLLAILVLRALTLEAQGKRVEALAALESTLMLAQLEGYVRLFVDEGTPMRDLLRHAQTSGIYSDYVSTLLSVFEEKQVTTSPPTRHPDQLAEPLTEREREVLCLLLEGASNREIAQRLVLSVNTVKRHVYNLCGKLGVQSRTQAIALARAINLL